MKKDLREKIGAIMGLDENLLMMSREMGDSDMTGDENGEGFENIFNIICIFHKIIIMYQWVFSKIDN